MTDKKTHFLISDAHIRTADGIKAIRRAGNDIKTIQNTAAKVPEERENGQDNCVICPEGYRRSVSAASVLAERNRISLKQHADSRKRDPYKRRKSVNYMLRPLTALLCILFTVAAAVTGMIGGVYGYSQSQGILDSDVSMTGTDIFCWPLPVNGRITSYFGIRNDPFTGEEKMHGGIDIAAASGTPVLASADGTVTAVSMDDPRNGYGYYVKLDHGEDKATLYGHCSVICVQEGQRVLKGEMIARVGSTGNSTGDHLHFEIRINGLKQDPLSFFVNNYDISEDNA